MTTTNANIRKNVIIPLSITVILLISIATASIYWIQNSHLKNEINQESSHLSEMYHALVNEEIENFQGLLDLVTNNQRIIQAWNNQNRQILYDTVSPTYSKLNSKHRVTHFYFHDLDGRVFLRMHKPGRYGDLIQRQTLVESIETKQPVSGLEIGLFGSLVLRVVQPWYVNNQLIGYVELGEEIDFIAPQLVKIMDFVIYVTLKKSHLKYEDWKNYQEEKQIKSEWDTYPSQVITYQSIDSIPEEINTYFSSSLKGAEVTDWRVDHLSQNYHGRSLVLKDISNNPVGEMLFLINTTELKQDLHNTILTFVIAGVFLSIFILIGFYKYLGSIENQIKRSNEKLEAEISERKMTEEMLTQKGKELEASNTELESYSYSIAHDLRTPLRSIVSFSQILHEDTRDKLTDDEKNSLERIINAAKRMAELISDILELSKVSRGNMNFAEINLSELVESAAKRFCHTSPMENITFNIHKDIKTHGDVRLVSMVIDNLIENACKYSSKMEDIQIEFGSITKDAKRVFYVKDNGIGFDMEYADNIFKPFQRLHKVNEYEGTGIGLATVERIVRRHGGKIWVEAKPDQGATFYFELGIPKTSSPT